MRRVIRLFTCADKGLPMNAQDSVNAIQGVGLEGDRYATGKGAYSNSKRVTIRQVSLIAVEAINEANSILAETNAPFSRDPKKTFTCAETRRNIVTEGVDLNELVGKEFTVGAVRMRGVEWCDPCARPSKLTGKQSFETAFTARGGLRAEVLSSGTIYIHDRITV